MEWKKIAVAGIGAVIAAGVGTSYVKEHYDQIDKQSDREYRNIQEELGQRQERLHRIKEQDYGPLLSLKFL